MVRVSAATDIAGALPAVHVPTLVTAREGSRAGDARDLVGRIAGAQLAVLPGVDHMLLGGDSDAFLRAVEGFLPDLGAARRAIGCSRRSSSSTSSTRRAERWRWVTGPGPSSSRLSWRRSAGCWCRIGAARWTRRATACSRRSTVPAGRSAVPSRSSTPRALVASRSAPACTPARSSGSPAACAASPCTSPPALPGPRRRPQVLVTGTVRDLVAGSGLAFDDRGIHALKGIPEPYRLWSVRP